MNKSRFTLYLILCSILSYLGAQYLPALLDLSILETSGWVFTIFFAAFCLVVFFMSKGRSDIEFIRFFMLSIILKMVAALVVLLIYRSQASEFSNGDVIAFLWSYLVFTVFETWYLMKVKTIQKS